MIKFDVKNRYTGTVKFTAEIDCGEDEKLSVKLGLAVKWAIKNDANLSCANLRDANLRDADLSCADLSKADLSCADLSEADLREADLSCADLSEADLSCANLRDANLRDADLRCANLSCANLREADLRDADLRDADLRDADLLVFQGFGARAGSLYAYKTKDGEIQIRTGCYFGLIDDFIDKVKSEPKDNNYAKDYLIICELIKFKFGTKGE